MQCAYFLLNLILKPIKILFLYQNAYIPIFKDQYKIKIERGSSFFSTNKYVTKFENYQNKWLHFNVTGINAQL